MARQVNMMEVESNIHDIGNVALMLEQLAMNDIDIDDLNSLITFQAKLLNRIHNNLRMELKLDD